jgi:hypothetical protein
MNTISVFRKHNIELIIEFCRNDSLVSRARNNLVARAMGNPKMTHIMFIDNDDPDNKNTVNHIDGNKFNKNLILLSLREMTSLSTKEIRISLRRFKKMYDGILGGFLE